MNSLIFCLFLLFVWYTTFVNGLYFHMGETEKKCFIQDIAENTTVTGNGLSTTVTIFDMFFCIISHMSLGSYKLEVWNGKTGEYLTDAASRGLGVIVKVKSPDEETILNRVRYLFIYLSEICEALQLFYCTQYWQ